MSPVLPALRIGLVAAGGVLGAVVSARRAGSLRRRAVVMRRVAGDAPVRARRPAALLAGPPDRLVAELRVLDLPIDAARLWRWWTRCCLVALVLGSFIAGPVLGVLGGTAVAVFPLVVFHTLRGRADAGYDATLASALDAVGRAIRSGGSLSQAVVEASASVRGSVGADLTLLAASVARGRPFAAALVDWREARPRPSVRLSVGALVLAAQTGGPPARVIEDVASAIRTRQQVAHEAHALAAQARLSAVVVGLAPIGFMAVSCLTDPRNAHLLFGTPIGVTCLVVGLALDAVGAVWMHRMSAAVTS